MRHGLIQIIHIRSDIKQTVNLLRMICITVLILEIILLKLKDYHLLCIMNICLYEPISKEPGGPENSLLDIGHCHDAAMKRAQDLESHQGHEADQPGHKDRQDRSVSEDEGIKEHPVTSKACHCRH